MPRERHTGQMPPGTAPGPGTQVGPYEKKRAPIRVSFGVYAISLLVVALVIFIFMLVQYLPGYRTNHRLQDAIKGSEYVYIGIRVPKEVLKKRKVNPLTKEDDIAKILRDMGAKKATAEINPDQTNLPYEKSD